MVDYYHTWPVLDALLKESKFQKMLFSTTQNLSFTLSARSLDVSWTNMQSFWHRFDTCFSKMKIFPRVFSSLFTHQDFTWIEFRFTITRSTCDEIWWNSSICWKYHETLAYLFLRYFWASTKMITNFRNGH